MTAVFRTMLVAALEYSQQHGMPVFPVWGASNGRCHCGKIECEHPGKHPIGRLVPHGFKDATTDEATIRKWWDAEPEANIGTPTADRVVLDVDSRHGGDEALAALEQQHGPLPETAVVHTGGGGRHFHFSKPSGTIGCNAGKLGRGLDIKADGGYVLLPPSTHASGDVYRDDPDHPLFEVQLALIPQWMLNHLTAGGLAVQSSTNGRSPEADWAGLLTGAPEGQRHAVAARIAGHYLRKNIPPDEVEQIVLGFARGCTPPLPADEVKAIVRDLAKKDAVRAAAEATSHHEPERRIAPWPTLESQALHGLAGQFVRLVELHTEADPAGLLVQFLEMFGSAIGRGPHAVVEADRHYTNIFAVLVGVTAKGRKGTSLGQTRARFRTVDEVWEQDRIVSGLSSGEGLIWEVRDPIEKQEPVKEKGRIVAYQTVIVDQGVSDKRLLVVEPEFASVLRIVGRDGNTLSAIIRQAWDTGVLRTLVKNSPATATDAHISIIGHVTKAELLRYLDRTDLVNGFANRFLWVCVRRARVLPEGGHLATVDFAPFIRQLKDALDFARKLGDTAVSWDREARVLWHEVYEDLSEGHPGLLGAILSRAEAQVLRLALIYALLDQSPEIRRVHLEAALALWRYCEASANYIFGDAVGDPVADEILAALRAQVSGLTRSEIRDLFGRHRKSDEIGRALGVLLEHGLARFEHQDSGGRPTERWYAGGAKSAESAKTQGPPLWRLDR